MFLLSITKKKLILFLVDVIIIITASFLAAFIRFGRDVGVIYIQEHLFVFLLTGIVFLVFFYIADLYDVKKDFHSPKYVGEIILSGVLTFIISGFLIYGYRLVMPGRGVFFLYVGGVTSGIIIWRYVFTHLAKHLGFKIRTAIIGVGDAQKNLVRKIEREKNSGVKLLGFVSTEPSIEVDRFVKLPVLGKIEELENVIEKYQIMQLVVEDRHQITEELKNILIRCFFKGVKVIDIPSFYQEHWCCIPLAQTSQEWLYQELARKGSSFISYVYEQNLKRLVDLAGGGIGFILFLPFFIPIAIAIKLNSKGPIFYQQKRLGQKMEIFYILKFRTMVHNAEKDSGAVWAEKDDPRITRVGRFLRRMRLDEFPQLLNVLKGEMSLVGPRPEREEFVNQFLKKIPYYSIRFLVKPGITGWAQINQGYVNSYQGSRDKLEYELYYIFNHSFFLDMGILLKSIKIVLLGSGK